VADVGASFRAVVVANATVAGLIGTRMIPDELDQNAKLPASTYHRISTTHVESLEGTDVLLASTIMEVRAYGKTRQQSIDLANAIRRSGVNGMRGTFSGVAIRSCSTTGGRRDYTEPPIDGTHEMRYVASQDFRIFYEDSPT